MIDIIKKKIKISCLEMYNKISFMIFINIFVLIFVIGIQCGDITLKVFGNFFIVNWISINVYYIFSMFKKGNRGFLLDLSRLSRKKNLLVLYMLSGIMNIAWFVINFVSLIIVMKATLMDAFVIALVQYIFALAIGAICGVLYKKNIGIILITGLATMNFFLYNPLLVDASSHFLSISEQLHVINKINITNIISLIIIIIFCSLFVFISSNPDVRFRIIKIIALVALCFSIYMGIIYIELIKYENNASENYNISFNDRHIIESRGIEVSRVEDICMLLFEFEKLYKEIHPKFEYKKYILDKKYLSSVSWKVKGDIPETICFENDTVHINILSDSMIYFENADFLESFLDDLIESAVVEIEGYRKSRYTKHMIDGYSIAIIKTASANLDVGDSKTVEKKSIEKIEDIFNYPTTKQNYVFRVALIIYEKYNASAGEIYRLILKENPQSDEEFVRLLEDNYDYITKDKEMQKILNKIKK